MPDEPQDPVIDADAVEESKPLAKDLVVRGAAVDEQAIFRTMDRHDEAQILDELVGRQLAVMLYSFKQGGKTLTDLSYAGVQEVVRTLNARGATRIKVAAEPRPEFETVMEGDQSFIQCTAYAEDTLNGGGAWGTSEQAKNLSSGRRDVFARNKALSKAQRNAEKVLIPEEFRQLLIARYLKDEVRVKEIREGLLSEEDLPQLPPPLDDDEMRLKVEQARAAYVEIGRHAPGGVAVKLTPATFYRYITRAETDHERMDEFLAFLADKLAQAKAKGEAHGG